jgi:tetratricopeptide (TPR) repeat protein
VKTFLAGVLVLLAVSAKGSETTPGFVGWAVCAACHPAEADAWRGSHHDLAMQEAREETILGDFAGATFTAYGVTSRFFRNNGKYFVHTEGAEGAFADYEIAYVFGIDPLQQYLVAFPGGRYQVLGIAWDTRPKDKGGQRWFHLYPDEPIAHDDALHWTGINQNWNFMCAECHSTDLRRNYDLESDRYQTSWAEIDVACEACHGPGSQHVAWAERPRAGEPKSDSPGKGLLVRLAARRHTQWQLAADAVTATRTMSPEPLSTEVETCAPCHSRRAPIGDGHDVGRPLLDGYRLSLLDERLYQADGQIADEVYVYGSFVQSKMYRAGVTCGDCHDPHSLHLRAEGNGVCTQCHLPARFDDAGHHFHRSPGPGSECVDCHAPATTYMVVDPRRDHSFRIPRPDLSVRLGVRNACTGCHTDRSDAWAAARVDAWYGGSRAPHFAVALAAGRSGAPGATENLIGLAEDPTQPAITRATAVEGLATRLDRNAIATILRGLKSDEALIRLAALGGLAHVTPRDRYPAAFPLLKDPLRAVRLEAARVLAPVPPEALPEDRRPILEAAFDDYERSLRQVADRPEGLMTFGNFLRDRGKLADSERWYEAAITRHPRFAPSYINLADLYRTQGRDADGKRLLKLGLEQSPNDAGLAHAYGLLLVREKRYGEAVPMLGQAATLDPGNPRYGYVYALALQRIGNGESALQVLERAHQRHPNDRDILYALATTLLQRGDRTAASKYAEALAQLSPNDPEVARLLEAIRGPGN